MAVSIGVWPHVPGPKQKAYFAANENRRHYIKNSQGHQAGNESQRYADKACDL